MPSEKKLVVNLFGGASAGKSDCARILCSMLNRKKIICEYSQEYAKKLTWKNDFVTRSNQVFVTAAQFDDILTLYNQVDVVVTDGPIINGIAYPGPCCTKNWHAHVKEMHDYFNNLNIFLVRNNDFYQAAGRTQNLQECIKADEKILNFLKTNDITYESVPVNEHTVNNVLHIVMNKIKKEKT